ncbi:hypothetical protein OK074_5754 [Actinobacteria bacterium OK074]|nr:hypothetical protein OK074_5754 [Actinobacteria bacterium OK074]
MSQPPFQPPPPPPPAQPPQNPYAAYNNPYAQPAPPQQPPAGFGQPPMYPGQPPQPPYPGPQFQAPAFGQQPPNANGNPVGAVFLAFFVSVIVSLLYSGLVLATYKDVSLTMGSVLYLAHALVNGAIVGALIGSMAHRSNGARVGGAVIAALGAFFGYANALPLIFAVHDSPMALKTLLEYEPFFPAKAWWTDETGGGVDWYSPLGLVIAAATAWAIAYTVGTKQRRA